MSSEDLDEVLALAEQVAVMFEGRLMAVRDRAAVRVEEIGLLMAGSGA